MSLVEIVTDLKNKKLDGFLTLTDDIIGIIKVSKINHYHFNHQSYLPSRQEIYQILMRFVE